MGGLLHLVQRGGAWAGLQPAQTPPRCTKCNRPPINGQCLNRRIAVYNGPLLCSINVPIKGLNLSVTSDWFTNIVDIQMPHARGSDFRKESTVEGPSRSAGDRRVLRGNI